MTDILEKTDLFDFEKRLLSYLELISANPMKEWFSLEELAQLRQCSISELYKNHELLPNNGLAEDKWGRTPVWSRRTVNSWLLRTRKELEVLSNARTPEEVEKTELQRSYQSLKDNKLFIV